MEFGDDPLAKTCTCFDCWSGESCSIRLADDDPACMVQAGSGTPYLFEEYWIEHPEPVLEVLPSYHIGYGDHLPRLERAIRELHRLVGNAVVDGKYMVIGIGSTELISAAMYALAPRGGNGSKALVWSRTPYYSGYEPSGRFYRTNAFGWGADAPATPQASAAQPVIELVTSPNNPDGHIRAPSVAAGEYTRYVMDHAYYWPHFTALNGPVSYGNDTLALFTLSKMTGHASTRVGWALTPDEEVAQRLAEFVHVATFGAPRESQLRAILLLEHVNQHIAEVFDFARGRMLGRWHRLEGIFAAAGATAPFRLEPRDPPSADTFSGVREYEASPAYAWIELTDASLFNGSALTAMESVGIAGRGGSSYGETDDRHVRLELLMREQTFEILCRKLEKLVGAAS